MIVLYISSTWEVKIRVVLEMLWMLLLSYVSSEPRGAASLGGLGVCIDADGDVRKMHHAHAAQRYYYLDSSVHSGV